MNLLEIISQLEGLHVLSVCDETGIVATWNRSSTLRFFQVQGDSLEEVGVKTIGGSYPPGVDDAEWEAANWIHDMKAGI